MSPTENPKSKYSVHYHIHETKQKHQRGKKSLYVHFQVLVHMISTRLDRERKACFVNKDELSFSKILPKLIQKTKLKQQQTRLP